MSRERRLTSMAPELAPASVKPTVRPARPAGRACATFLAGNGDYVKGVVGLAKGLRKVRSAYPLVVAVLPTCPTSTGGSWRDRVCGPGDRAGLPAREPDPIRRGVLCYQLFQATHLGGKLRDAWASQSCKLIPFTTLKSMIQVELLEASS